MYTTRLHAAFNAMQMATSNLLLSACEELTESMESEEDVALLRYGLLHGPSSLIQTEIPAGEIQNQTHSEEAAGIQGRARNFGSPYAMLMATNLDCHLQFMHKTFPSKVMMPFMNLSGKKLATSYASHGSKLFLT